MPRQTHKQTANLATINKARLKLTMRYAFRMRRFIVQWEIEGLSQRHIVERLNEAGAPVPSEYTGEVYRPAKGKSWSLIQYQRFRKQADDAAVRMALWAKKNGATHTRAYGDGRGLFRHPTLVGLPTNINRRTYSLKELREERDEAKAAEAERMKDPVYKRRREESLALIERFVDEVDNDLPHVPKPPVRVGKLLLPHPDEVAWEEFINRR
jgi:hypothetical protein